MKLDLTFNNISFCLGPVNFFQAPSLLFYLSEMFIISCMQSDFLLNSFITLIFLNAYNFYPFLCI